MVQENSDLIKLLKESLENSQKTQRWNSAVTIITGLTSFFTIVILVWQILKQKKKLTLAERMMQEEEIQARSKLRMKFLKREANHETALSQMKSGLGSLEELEEKGEKMVQDQADQAKKAIEDQIKNVKDKLKDKLFKKE